MSNPHDHTLPRVRTGSKPGGNRFAGLHRPVAGATHERVLPRGRHPLQRHSLATPKGMKTTVMLATLLAAGQGGAGYEARDFAPRTPYERRSALQSSAVTGDPAR